MSVLVGRVGLVVKGAWDSSVAYAAMDVATYNNSTYIAKQAVPAGTLPTNTTYWELSLDASLLANKVTSAVNGNLAGLNSSGDLTDAGWSADKTTTAVTPGNPLSISSLKSAQLAIDPVVTFSSAVSSVTLKVANGSDSTAPGYAVSTNISESLGESTSGTWNVRTGMFTKSDNTTIQLTPHEVVLVAGDNYISSNGTSVSLSYHNGEMTSQADVSQLWETVNELGNFLEKKSVKRKRGETITGAGGDFYLLDGGYPHIISVVINQGLYLALLSYIKSSNTYAIFVKTYDTLSPVANTNIEFDIYYTD